MKCATSGQTQARRLVFDRVGSISVETDQIGVVWIFSLLICLFINIISGSRNTIKRYMASFSKSCRPGKGAV